MSPHLHLILNTPKAFFNFPCLLISQKVTYSDSKTDLSVNFCNQAVTRQVILSHINPADPAVLIGLVVIDSSAGIYTAGICGNIPGSTGRYYGPPHHGHPVQNMKKLRHIFLLRAAADRIPLQKSCPYEAGYRGGITRQTGSSHSLRAGFQFQTGGKPVYRRRCLQIQILIQIPVSFPS